MIMEQQETVYRDIASRTGGDIYIGVVGPVRTGKSTLIKRFMETLVLPHMENSIQRERMVDELPQSAAGRTIMTTEPKFIPEEAVKIRVDDSAEASVRLIDCVGYIVPSAIGYVEDEMPRMVMTPWFTQEIPFNMAAEIGTRKVITEHSTIGLVVTTDGSISDIPRSEYEEAEERVIAELQELEKPFVILLNCVEPESASSKALCREREEKYGVPVEAVNCLHLTESDIREILTKVLYQFPVREISFEIPRWLVALEKDHWLKNAVYKAIGESASRVSHISSVRREFENMDGCEYIERTHMLSVDPGKGAANVAVSIPSRLLYQVMEEKTGLAIRSEEELMPCLIELAQMKKSYEKIKGALEEVNATGYGIVMPSLEEMRLEEPEIIKQGGRYGIRLKASAPSIHMMRADIMTEVAPIVGSEKQSEELVSYLLGEFEESPQKIWESNIFGKSLHDLVNEGLHNKLYRMPGDARVKLQETIERIINEGCSGLICIIL